jgi:TolA-binding protein
MEAQEATTDYLFKIWAWFEANAKLIAFGAVVAVVAIFAVVFYFDRQGKKEIEAGEALTQADMVNTGAQLVEMCQKIAADYPATAAGQRALLQAATTLFVTDKFAEAQAQFQKFLDAYPDNVLAPQAALGVAASLDAQGKTDAAMSAYQKAINQTTDASVVATAKFALARIAEAQGKATDAQKIYAEIARAYPNSPMSSEAEMRDMELRTKSPAAPATTVIPATSAAPATATAPFTLSH